MNKPQPDTAPAPGVMEVISPGIRRILAPNPSPMTYWGTNTFVLGEGDVAVVDPGPHIPAHMQAILAGLAPGEQVAQILVTHAHLDHSPLARALSQATGAPIYGFGPAEAGQSEVMKALAAQGLTAGGEGVDHDFRPDLELSDGERFVIGSVEIEALHTPGHMANHLSFALGDVVLTGDLVMGWASTLISPPDGDLTAFLASCERLKARSDRLFLPAHGAPITDPAARLDWLIAHRRSREAAILEALGSGEADIATLARQIYTDTPAALLPAAERNIFAHLIDLTGRNLTRALPQLSVDAKFIRL
ncbi:MAG: MBL fold metallo-hydrolase [Maritimibacter sp.]